MKTKKAIKSARPLIPFKRVEEVARGVALLDAMFGRKAWLKRMDMSNFDIRDGNVCVAGNVFKDAFMHDTDSFSNDDGYERFRELMRAVGGDSYGERFGFYNDNEKSMQHLQDLWVMVIKALKKGRAVRGIAKAA